MPEFRADPTIPYRGLNWALEQGIWRLKPAVMAHNERAIRLYETFGFTREVVKRSAIVAGERAVDETVMGKLLKKAR
jgi:RimJ/RimL family protein N-acetyltransferase